MLLGFPLYFDAMPSIKKAFIERLTPYIGRKNNPRLAFLVQSGFEEGHHSRFVERYLKKLAKRLNTPYAGTIIKGNCEGVRLRSERTNLELFQNLHKMGVDLARSGCFDDEKLAALAKPERFSRLYAFLYKLKLRLPSQQAYWNRQLQQNNAYENRFARPLKDNPGNK